MAQATMIRKQEIEAELASLLMQRRQFLNGPVGHLSRDVGTIQTRIKNLEDELFRLNLRRDPRT